MEKRLKKLIIILYGLPPFGFQLLINFELYYLTAFLTDYAKIPLDLVGTVLMITNTVDIIGVPLSGVVLEKTNMRWGKYRSWLLVGPPIAVFFFVLQFTKIGSSMTSAIIITISFIISHLLNNVYYSAHISMNSSLTTINEERIAMSSNRGIFNALGGLLFSLTSMPLILALGKSNAVNGYTYAVIIGGIIMIACYYIFFYVTKDYSNYGVSTQASNSAEKMSASEMVKQIVTNIPLLGLLFGEIGRFLGRFIIFGMAFYYFKYVVNNLTVITMFFTGLTVVCIIGALIAKPLANKIGPRNTYMLSLFIFIVGLLVVWMLPMSHVSFMILMFISYFGYAIPDAIIVAMYASTVEYGEWKTGKNARGLIMSLINLPTKISILLRSIIITGVLASAGYVANMQPTAKLISGIKNGIALIPAIIMTISFVFIMFLYKITPNKLEQMQKEIAERKVDEVSF